MKILRILSLGILFTMPLHAEAPRPIAIVYSLTGEVSLTVPHTARRPLNLFDRLPAGTALEVGPDSHLALAFVNGLRYELGEKARVTLGRNGLANRTGAVRPLPRVPRLPRLSPIAKEDHPGPRASAVLIRSETISGLYPDGGAVSLASAARLRFDPVPAAPEYRVQILDSKGKVLFHKDTQTTEVSVPSGILAPGGSYLWTVETRNRPGAVARGEAVLVILDAGRAQAREELRRWVQRSGSEDDLRLLEGVDRTLGLQESHQAAGDSRCCLSGLAVETVTPESAAFRAGLMPGDRLFSWCRIPGGKNECVARGDFRTPFDWLDVQMEDVQRGGVAVEGARGSEKLRWNLLPTFQGLTVAPLFFGEIAEAYQSSLQAGDPTAAGEGLERVAERAERNHCAEEALWLRFRAAQLRAKARQWAETDAGYEAAVAKARSLGADRVESHLLMSWSEAFLLRGDLAQARQQLERALSLEEKNHPDSLAVATVLTRIGNVTERQDNLDETGRLYQRAYGLAFRIAPGSGSAAAAANNLAVSTGKKGDLANAESYAARALAIRENLTPAGDAIIPSLVNYGSVLYARGDFAGAEAAFLRAKGILEKIQPESVLLAKALHNLGEIAYQRGDDDAAENLFRRELALYEKLDPSGSLMLDSLMGLGEVALQRTQADKAEESLRRALAISGKSNPAGPKAAWCLRGLAAAAELRRQPAEAKELLQRALAIWEKINPESVDTGSIHSKLGVLLLDRGDLGAAEAHLQTAIRIHEKNRLALPESHHALARLQARRGHLKEAAAIYLMAVDRLEAQSTRLGGAQESQWLYGSSLGNLYFEAAENQIALAQPQEAWKLIERGRARGFQELLAQRDLRFAGELPESIYAERRRLDTEYDRAQADLAAWSPEQGPEKLENLQGRLQDLRLAQAEIQERIRRSSPRLGALENPAPPDLTTVRAALDPGTVLLEYAVGREKTWLFAVQPSSAAGPGLSVFSVAIRAESLREEIESFRRLLKHPASERAALQSQARRLYDLLVRPAEGRIAHAQRILLSPDGPLHTLPFAALLRGNRYLVEWKPVHSALSATVYAELTRSRPAHRDPGKEQLAAFGDPVYPAAAPEIPQDPEVQDAVRRGWSLKPLPSTRTEVEAIAALYPQAHAYLGPEATEERAKSLGPEARLIHFACHGLLDERFPLNSALALTLPKQQAEGQDNGLLQAWEIFERVRLNADLVTLSGCDTALGREMGGEGLVGLTRAFQYAGARSVLASLWGISDFSTAPFMQRFYGYLRNGKSKDEALRAAQIDQIRGKSGSSHPFYWAAFELFGDWR